MVNYKLLFLDCRFTVIVMAIRIYNVGSRIILKLPIPRDSRVVVNGLIVNCKRQKYYRLSVNGLVVDVYCDGLYLQLSSNSISAILRILGSIRFSS